MDDLKWRSDLIWLPLFKIIVHVELKPALTLIIC